MLALANSGCLTGGCDLGDTCDHDGIVSGECSSVICAEECTSPKLGLSLSGITKLKGLIFPLSMLSMIDSSSGLKTSWCVLKLKLCTLLYARDRFSTLSSKERLPLLRFRKVNVDIIFSNVLIKSGLSSTPSLPLSMDDYTDPNDPRFEEASKYVRSAFTSTGPHTPYINTSLAYSVCPVTHEAYRIITSTRRNCGIGSGFLSMSSIYCKDISKYIVDTATDNDIIISNNVIPGNGTTLVLISVGAILIFALIFLLVGYVLSRLKNCSSTRYTSGSSSDGIEIDRIKEPGVGGVVAQADITSKEVIMSTSDVCES
ncbi:hypothetical protein [Candidatus Ichthyocystis sparus]|uniref:hypothetical protein n=1 Tax=Candidatus Ichthyocystis sparus TaxID=1561004 RepID=UPI000B865CCF|nr:hypothetical protein [Candidatus Ichthyocystis sparus]